MRVEDGEVGICEEGDSFNSGVGIREDMDREDREPVILFKGEVTAWGFDFEEEGMGEVEVYLEFKDGEVGPACREVMDFSGGRGVDMGDLVFSEPVNDNGVLAGFGAFEGAFSGWGEIVPGIFQSGLGGRRRRLGWDAQSLEILLGDKFL